MSQPALRLPFLGLCALLCLPACVSVDGDGLPPGDTWQAPPVPENGVQLSIESFKLAPGEEVEKCRSAKAPALSSGMITRIELVARPGLHHAVVYKVNQDLDPQEVDCFGVPDEAMEGFAIPEPLFASTSQVTEESLEFPEGVGVSFEAGQQIIFNFHYINVTPEEIDAEIFINLYYAEDDSELEQARFYAFGNMGSIDIPAGHRQSLTSTCAFPSDMNVFSATPHMHRLGTGMEVLLNRGGQTEVLIATDGWEGANSAYLDPPAAVTSSDSMTFTCEWENPTATDVVFGQTFDDEMCFVFGFVYPAPGPVWGFDYNDVCVTDASVIEPL
jgi:hypothetical protein